MLLIVVLHDVPRRGGGEQKCRAGGSGERGLGGEEVSTIFENIQVVVERREYGNDKR